VRCRWSWYAQINLVAQKYITNVLDVIKMIWYNHLKIGIPENISQNKIILLGQYSSKLEKVTSSIKSKLVYSTFSRL